MDRQKVCVVTGSLVIAGLLLANNMFSTKPQSNENITNYNEIMIHTEELLNPSYIEVTDSIQGIAGITTYEFKNLKSVKNKKESKKKNNYSEEDLMLLAGIVQNEAGSDFISDAQQKSVASVVLNRVKSDKFPNTIKDVVFQKNPKQYDIRDGFYHPTKRAIKNAKYVLENGSVLPDNCLFQSETKLGDGVYKVFKTIISTTYICYIND